MFKCIFMRQASEANLRIICVEKRKASFPPENGCELNVDGAAGSQPRAGEEAFPCVQAKAALAQSLLRAP